MVSCAPLADFCDVNIQFYHAELPVSFFVESGERLAVFSASENAGTEYASDVRGIHFGIDFLRYIFVACESTVNERLWFSTCVSFIRCDIIFRFSSLPCISSFGAVCECFTKNIAVV